MNELAAYDEMLHAINRVHNLDECRELISRATAMRAYARQALNRDAEKKCQHIRFRAERRFGQIHAEIGNGRGHYANAADSPPTLAELEISEYQSQRWGRMAQLSDSDFEAALAADTINMLIRKDRKPPLRKASLLWLYHHLYELQRRGLLDLTQDDVARLGEPELFAQLQALALTIADWLSAITEEKDEVIVDNTKVNISLAAATTD